MKRLLTLFSAYTLIAILTACSSISPQPDKRNVILIIGDGMDDQQITIARNYLKGVKGKLALDTMPLRSVVQVLTVDEKNPEKPVYVADSANTASTLATGTPTSRGRIATSANTDQDLPTIAELAKTGGYATGIVTTASVTDATPASFMAHSALRFCESPMVMSRSDALPKWIKIKSERCGNDRVVNGGPGSIARQIASGPHDIVLGGGHKNFVQTAEESTKPILQMAQENNYQILRQPQDLANVNPQKKVLGLFAENTLPVRLQGQDGRPATNITKDDNSNENQLPEAMTCEPNPAFDGVPQLKQMTDTALQYLANQSEKGFFLMIESASIDKQSHYRKPCGSIGELEQLEEALTSALAFAKQQPNTLILITADHGQAAQLIPSSSLFATPGKPLYTPGKIARIKTAEDQILTVNYATSDFIAEEHTGVNVPLYSNDTGKTLIDPMVTQPQVFQIMRDYLKL